MSVSDGDPGDDRPPGMWSTRIQRLRGKGTTRTRRGWGDFLKATIKFEASDLIMKTGQPPKLRVKGRSSRWMSEPVTSEEWKSIAKHILTRSRSRTCKKFGSWTSRTTTTRTRSA